MIYLLASNNSFFPQKFLKINVFIGLSFEQLFSYPFIHFQRYNDDRLINDLLIDWIISCAIISNLLESSRIHTNEVEEENRMFW